MGTTKEALQRFEETAGYYLRELDQFSLEQLQQKPNDQDWSIGQMFQHLINSALFMQIRNIDQLLMPPQDGPGRREEKTEMGSAVFSQGSFPPVRIQVPPSPHYTPEQPESKEQLIDGLRAVMQRMKEIEPVLGQASKHCTANHPRFGGLCGEEWFLLVEMHYRHHLTQLDRLKRALNQHSVQ